MTGHGAKFGRKQEEAIAALFTHRTVEEAARSINVATKTLLRWLEVPAFKKEVPQSSPGSGVSGNRANPERHQCGRCHAEDHGRYQPASGSTPATVPDAK